MQKRDESEQFRYLLKKHLRTVFLQKFEQSADVEIAEDAIIYEGVQFIGKCKVGSGTIIYPNSVIDSSTIGENCVIKSSYIENSVVKNGVKIGPFAHLRPNSVIEDDCKIGNFVEIKNATLGQGTAASHLAYVGDVDVGAHCNIGCGAIFVNYDGNNKFRSTVGDNCFVGSNCNVIAPVNIANNTYICAGTTVTDDSEEYDFIIGRARPVVKKERAKKYLTRREEKKA